MTEFTKNVLTLKDNSEDGGATIVGSLYGISLGQQRIRPRPRTVAVLVSADVEKIKKFMAKHGPFDVKDERKNSVSLAAE